MVKMVKMEKMEIMVTVVLQDNLVSQEKTVAGVTMENKVLKGVQAWTAKMDSQVKLGHPE